MTLRVFRHRNVTRHPGSRFLNVRIWFLVSPCSHESYGITRAHTSPYVLYVLYGSHRAHTEPLDSPVRFNLESPTALWGPIGERLNKHTGFCPDRGEVAATRPLAQGSSLGSRPLAHESPVGSSGSYEFQGVPGSSREMYPVWVQ
jgi:hypothetical protein